MSKLVQAFLTGAFFTFILDFFLFLGIKLHYINLYAIDLYYNILFADNQNIFIYLLISLIIGYTIIYINNNKITAVILGFMFTLVSLTLIAPIGKYVGEWMFTKKNIILHDAKFTYNGDAYYIGRKKIIFYDYELKKVIILKKNRLKENN